MGNTVADNYDEQIAALESALTLPLPDATRAQIEQELSVLRAQRAAQLAGSAAAKIEGTTNVRGTLHGNAIGVNLGTMQTFFGPTEGAPRQQSASTTSQEEIDEQRTLLAAHRRTLAIYLTRLAKLGSANAPPEVAHGIREARDAIRRSKAVLRGWGADVADHPNDEAAG